MKETRIGIVGCGGRMGRMLLQVALERQGCTVGAGTEAPGGPLVGTGLAQLAGVPDLSGSVTDDPAVMFRDCDVVVDFSTPAVSVASASMAAETRTPLVIGVTGMDAEQGAAIRAAAGRVPILWAANMSLGINLLLSLVRQAAARLDESYDIEIVDMHHRHKVDSPSGAALALGRAAAAGRGVRLDAMAERGRDGATAPRARGAIGFAALRGGDVAGDHMVVFATEGERLELGHRASNRGVFARGAVTAACWIVDQPPGLYDMADLLGLEV